MAEPKRLYKDVEKVLGTFDMSLFDKCEFPEDLVHVITKFQEEVYSKMKNDIMSKVICRMKSWDDYEPSDYIEVVQITKRLETDREYKRRIKVLAKKQEKINKDRAMRLKMYNQLKKEFGD